MPLAATSSASTYVHLLAALGVELLRMTVNIASLSAHDLSTCARLWLRRLSRLPMAEHDGFGTTCFMMAVHIWPGSFGMCKRLPSHRRRRRIQRMLRMQLRGVWGSGGIRGYALFLGFLGLYCCRQGLGWFGSWVLFGAFLLDVL